VCGAIAKCQPGTSKCGVDPKLGEPCSTSADRCQASHCAGGVCVALLPGGSSCVGSNQCDSGRCDGGLCTLACPAP
jgi:hypothetical protein